MAGQKFSSKLQDGPRLGLRPDQRPSSGRNPRPEAGTNGVTPEEIEQFLRMRGCPEHVWKGDRRRAYNPRPGEGNVFFGDSELCW